jgi:hypothetical protein
MFSTTKNMKDIPVTIFLGVIIVVIFLLYSNTVLKSIPCGNSIIDVFKTNFVHIDLYHIIANLTSLYALSRIEIAIGWQKFLGLTMFLLIFNTIIEWAAKKLFPSLVCSIGFSGVLFGFMTWELVATKKLDLYLLASIIMITVLPSVRNKKASLRGHAIGAFSGIIGGLIWKYVVGGNGAQNISNGGSISLISK